MPPQHAECQAPAFHHNNITPVLAWHASERLRALLESTHPQLFAQTALVWINLAGEWVFVQAGKEGSHFVIAAYANASRQRQGDDSMRSLSIQTADGQIHGYVGIASLLPLTDSQQLLVHAMHLTLDPTLPIDELDALYEQFCADTHNQPWLNGPDITPPHPRVSSQAGLAAIMDGASLAGLLPGQDYGFPTADEARLQRSISQHPSTGSGLITSADIPPDEPPSRRPDLRLVHDEDSDKCSTERPEYSYDKPPATES